MQMAYDLRQARDVTDKIEVKRFAMEKNWIGSDLRDSKLALGMAREVMIPLVSGIEAFAHGTYDEAADGLVEQLPHIGGSHAQREALKDTILEGHIRRAGSTGHMTG